MRDLLIFEHIPKTAGTTLHAILWRLYGGRRVFFATDPGTHPARVAALHTRLADPANRLKAVVAHTGYGLHERLPAGYRYRSFTLLRDPVERTVSHYHYQIQRGKLDAATSLERFVREDPSRSCNVQTAFLGGLEVRRTLDGIPLSADLYTEALLQRAQTALLNLDAFGITERFDESLLGFRDAFGWPLARILYVRQRVGHRRRAAPDALSGAERRLVEQYNALDLELYAHARALFAERAAARGTRPRLATFQHVNRLYGRIVYPTTRPLVRTARALKGHLGS